MDSTQMLSGKQPGASASKNFAQLHEEKAETAQLLEAFIGEDLSAQNWCALQRRLLGDFHTMLPSGFTQAFETALVRVEQKLAEGKK